MLNQWMNDFRYRLRAVFRRNVVERELDDELQFHLERETEKYMAAGLSREAATRKANIAFGGIERTKEESRDARGVSILDMMSLDLRYAIRGLRARPGFTAAVIATLGLGIGANAAMFGVVDRLMFRPPAYLRDPGTVHRVYLSQTSDGKDLVNHNLSYTQYLDLSRESRLFSQVAAFQARSLAIGTGEETREMSVATISASLFDFFDARPALGRFFSAEEDRAPEGAHVAVLSYPFWQTRFGGRPEALGTALQVGSILYTIVGVAPRDFVGVPDADPPAVFIPITTFAASRHDQELANYYTKYTWTWMEMLVRRKPNVSLAAATADISTAYRRSYESQRALGAGLTPPELARPRVILGPIQLNRGPRPGQDAKVVVWISGVALIVLLIACANVANLFLARALRRRREISLRLALGVSRPRLLAQLLTESLLLASLGAIAGVLIAQVSGRILHRLFLPGDTSLSVVTDTRTLLFAGAAALVAGVLTGLAPILRAGRDDLATSLKAGAREGSYQRSAIRTTLLIIQGALSVVLLVGAGLFVRSLENVRSLRLGYDIEPVLNVELNMRGVQLPDAEQIALTRRLVERAKTVPGVTSAARALTVPLWNTWDQTLFVTGIDSVNRLGEFTLQAGSADYFQTTGTRILRGRGLTPADREGSPRVAIVSQAMAERLWPARNALGQCFRIEADTMPCTTVVGISENVRVNSLVDDPGFHYFLPIDQFNPQSAGLFIRVSGVASLSSESVRRALQQLMPEPAYVTITPMQDILDPQERSWQFGATMFLAFGALALVLAAIGLYSVISYNVVQRTHELGVRLALGAQTGDVLRLVIGDGFRFTIAGILVGGILALWAGHWMKPLLFSESPSDPLVLGSVIGILLAVAVVASAVPAWRASRVDPNRALRSE